MKIWIACAALVLAAESAQAAGDFSYYEQQDPISDKLMVGVVAEKMKQN